MKLLIRPNAADVARLAARLLAAQIERRADSVLGLATGRTMELIYDELVRLHENAGLDFSGCRSFNLDEYIGLPGTDPNSYRSTMNERLFGRVNFNLANTNVPDGMASNHGAEAQRYEACIRVAGGIDLQLLGLGETGHIGFNEPLSSFASRTRDVTLAPGSRLQNAVLFGGEAGRVPVRAITMGIATILDAKRILLIATGSKKASILAKTVEGPVTAMISGTALHHHRDVLVLADEDAAAGLTQRDYYDWVARHDPQISGLRD